MDQRSGRGLVAWRAAILALAAIFWVEQFAHAQMAEFGWQFRFLTIWALTLSLMYAANAFRLALGLTHHRQERLAMVAACVNAIMVTLYWWMRLSDPSALGPWEGGVRDLYLHAIGPGLQIVDAVFVLGAFGRPIRAVPGLLLTVVAYVAWIELGVAPLNDAPIGDVTSGLPYPFLNHMDPGNRATFYVAAALGGLAFLGAFHIVFRRVASLGRDAGGAAPAE